MALSDTMRQALEPYFDLDFLDPLSAPRKKKDGNYYTTYIAELQPSLMTLVPDSGSVILKEISPAQADIRRDKAEDTVGRAERGRRSAHRAGTGERSQDKHNHHGAGVPRSRTGRIHRHGCGARKFRRGDLGRDAPRREAERG